MAKNDLLKKALIVSAVILFVLWVILLVSDSSILVYSKKVEVGENYYVEEWGNLGDANQASLYCKGFHGLGFIDYVYWYSPSDFMGRSHCPFILKR